MCRAGHSAGKGRVQEAIQPIADGAILYDPALSEPPRSEWFEPEWWRSRGALVGEAGGRGRALFLQAGESQWVLRQFRRGGIVQRLVQARYLWLGERRTRGFAEWRMLARLHDAGLPVPRPVAARYRRVGRCCYTAELITRRLPDSRTLRELYGDDEVPPQVWGRVGAVVRQVHDAGVFHADLNAGNLLVEPGGAVHVLDFDQARLRPPGRWCERNLARLRRSLQKTAVEAGREALETAHWEALLDGYRHPTG